MLSIAFARPGRIARLALALVALAGITSCGSGAVSGPPQVDDPTRITILPATATLYAGLPTTFIISGGTGSYLVSSSNQAIVQVSGSVTQGSLTVIPNPVLTETPVTITVRDTGTTPTSDAALTVRPNTVSNSITITPSATQGGTCDPAVCSGGDATVSTTISQGGIPLSARGVTFSVVSGSFAFITTPPGQAFEELANSITVATDETGKAQVRLRVPSGAANQTALLRITDIGTGAYREASFTIAQATGESPGFFVTPSAVVFSGRTTEECAQGVEATFNVFGGRPPYSITGGSTAFTISPQSILASGGSFVVRPNGICVAEPGLPITIVDAGGRTAVATVANVPGTVDVPALVVAPTSVALTDCNSQATVSLAGGTGHYVVSAGSNSILAELQSQNSLRIRRNPGTVGVTPTAVGVTSGNSGANIAVTMSGDALTTTCAPLLVTPSTVNLTSCGPVNAAISGGTPPYQASSPDPSIDASVSGSTLTIQRTSPSPLAPSASTITVTDSVATGRFVNVNSSGAGAGACP